MTRAGRSMYYFVTARYPQCWPFYRVTVYTRTSAFVIVVIMFFAGMITPLAIGFVAVDLAGAIWTYLALQKDFSQGALT